MACAKVWGTLMLRPLSLLTGIRVTSASMAALPLGRVAVWLRMMACADVFQTACKG